MRTTGAGSCATALVASDDLHEVAHALHARVGALAVGQLAEAHDVVGGGESTSTTFKVADQAPPIVAQQPLSEGDMGWVYDAAAAQAQSMIASGSPDLVNPNYTNLTLTLPAEEVRFSSWVVWMLSTMTPMNRFSTMKVVKTMKTMMLTMYATQKGMQDQGNAMSDGQTKMGDAFNKAKNDDSFYVPPEIFIDVADETRPVVRSEFRLPENQPLVCGSFNPPKKSQVMPVRCANSMPAKCGAPWKSASTTPTARSSTPPTRTRTPAGWARRWCWASSRTGG